MEVTRMNAIDPWRRGGRSAAVLRGLRWCVGAALALILTVPYRGPAWAAAGGPQTGGTIVYALGPQDINWYLPLRPTSYSNGVDYLAATMMYKPLFRVGGDGKIDYSHSIASAITWSQDGTVYTVRMDPKWHWSDGRPVTAADVLFTWHLIQAASAKTVPAPWPYNQAGFGGIPDMVKSVTVAGPTEFAVTLTHPVNQIWFEYDGLAQFWPLPEHDWNKFPNDPAAELAYLTKNGNNPAFFSVVDGPWKMESATDKQAWVFVPNPAYSGHKPYLDRFIYAYQTSAAAEEGALRTGAVQVGYLPATDYDIRDRFPNDRFFTSTGYGFCRIFLNFGHPSVGPILGQLPVRQAMAYGIDQPDIITQLYHGQAVAGMGPVPLIPPTFLDPKLRNPPYPFDLTAGKRTLLEHGWSLKNGIMTNAQGQQLKFTMQYVSGNPTTEALVQLIQSDWAKEGIAIQLEPRPFTEMIGMRRRANAANWEIQSGICFDWGGSYPTGDGMFTTGGGYNFFQYSDPEMDRLVTATLAPHPTPAAAQASLNAYEEYVARMLPQIWVPRSYAFHEVQTNVHGVVETLNNFTGVILPQYWWIAH
jgi:peptide/nickel transport system substrate-binding protein